MSTATPPLLDADELFALGLAASARNDAAAAMQCFKQALQLAPDHARAHWALATEYAALQMTDRAAQHFEQAVALDPAQPVARFQCGLLHLTCGRVEPAAAVWAPLDDLPPEAPLRLFKNGLLHLARDEFGAALALLQQGLADPTLDAALRRDMQQLAERVQAAAAAQPAADTPAPAEGHLALAAYTRGAGPH